jgi:polygalacturonase
MKRPSFISLRHSPVSLCMLVVLCVVYGLLPGATVSHAATPESIAAEIRQLYADVPFSMLAPRVPQFPNALYDVRTFGAVADGATLNTKAFTDAIHACSAGGGGTVFVPPGTWRVGPIELVSNVHLRLERGCLLQLSNRIEDFGMIPKPGEASGKFMVAPPIYANGARNIAITGSGIIDGAGERWRYVLHEKQTERQWNELVASGGVVSPNGKEWWPSRAAMEGKEYLARMEKENPSPSRADFERAKEYLRPDLVYLFRCEDIIIDGPTFRNSPRYHLHPVQSENIIIRNVIVQTDWFAMNGDGIDLSSCRNVVVYRSTLDVGDDGICLKPAAPGPQQTPGPSCAQIVIADCVVYHAHGGFVIGSESFGGVRNISVRNCVFINTDVGIRFKSLRGKGGTVERVYISNIQMRNIMTEAILLDMYYSGGAPEVESAKDRSVRTAMPLNDRTPRFRDISIRNVVCDGAARAVMINGLPEQPITGIHLDSVFMNSRQGVVIIDADSIDLNHCSITAVAGPIIGINEGRHVTVNGGIWTAPAGATVRIDGAGSSDIRLRGTGLSPRAIDYGHGATPGAVALQ